MSNNPFEPPKSKKLSLSNEEIKAELELVIKVNKKLLQAFSLRSSLIKKRMKIFNAMNNRQDASKFTDEEKRKFSNYNKIESNLMKIVENSKDETLRVLRSPLILIDKDMPKKDQKQVSKILSKKFGLYLNSVKKLNILYIDFVEKFYEEYEKIIERLKFEKFLLKNISNKNFITYLDLIIDEIKKQEKVEKQLEDLQNKGKILFPLLSLIGISGHISMISLNSFLSGDKNVFIKLSKLINKYVESDSPGFLITSVVIATISISSYFLIMKGCSFAIQRDTINKLTKKLRKEDFK